MFFQNVKLILTDSLILKKFLFLIFGLVIFRLLASIPIPELSSDTLASIVSQSQILGVFNLFSGGGLANFSIAMLGVFPYITVAIILQLLLPVFPALNSMYNEEGEAGRAKVNFWIRVVTIPVAMWQAVGLLFYFKSQNIIAITLSELIIAVILITAGAMLTMWIGELMTQYGIGNGISLIVFAGIVVNIPSIINQAVIAFNISAAPIYVAIAIGLFIAVMFAVWINEAERPIPATHSRHGASTIASSQKVETYIPIKVNPVGVLPLIIGITLMAFILFAFRKMSLAENMYFKEIGIFISDILANGYYYAIPVVFLTVYFTYVLAETIISPHKIAKSLQTRGAFIPGIRPGEETEKYIYEIINRVIFYSAVFFSFIAALPFLVTGSSASTLLFSIGGTGLIIIVSIVIDIYKRIKIRLIDLQE